MASEWDAIVFRFLDAAIRSTVLAAAVAAGLAVLRVRSSRLRHAAWTGVLAGMIAMPALAWVLPPVDLPFLVLPAGLERVLRPEPAAAPRASRDPALDETAAGPGRPAARAGAGSTGERPSRWPVVVLLVYGIGAGGLLLRMGIGWRARTRFVQFSRTDVTPDRVVVCESKALAAPVTCGILRPIIVLPRAWRTWPDAKRQIVLAHERAHVRRHDPLVGFAARVNCVLFWWHPLAWWLNRTIAETAEQACDEAAVAATGDAERYAATLVEMADAVRARGARVAWHGLGMSGTGLLHRRIERILQGMPVRRDTRARQAVVAALCVASVWLSAAARAAPPASSRLVEVGSAVFGAARGAADVTPIVRHLLESDDEFYAAPAWMEVDPAIGDVKQLVILYTHGGEEHVFTMAEPGAVSRSILAEHARAPGVPRADANLEARIPAGGALNVIAAHYGQGSSYTAVTARVRELIQPDDRPFVVEGTLLGLRRRPPANTLIVSYAYQGRRATLVARAGTEVSYSRLVAHAASAEPHGRAGAERPAWLGSVRVFPPREPGDPGPGYGQSPRKELAIAKLVEARAELEAMAPDDRGETVSRVMDLLGHALAEAQVDVGYAYPRLGSAPLVAPVERAEAAAHLTGAARTLTIARQYLASSSARPRSAAARAGAIDAMDRALAELRTIWDADGAR